MPKQLYTINKFDAGINTVKDARDLSEPESSAITNMAVDAQGKIKSAGSLVQQKANPSDVSGSVLSKYISKRTARLEIGTSAPGTITGRLNLGGGYNFFYFESDHSIFDDIDSNVLTVGSADGNISFGNPQNTTVDGVGTSSSADIPGAGSTE
jgi:hypothetical protein|tara:strand:- start:322 stop:780 length:459 start_codon:yes stop_codon:yes gene_type:complete